MKGKGNKIMELSAKRYEQLELSKLHAEYKRQHSLTEKAIKKFKETWIKAFINGNRNLFPTEDEKKEVFREYGETAYAVVRSMNYDEDRSQYSIWRAMEEEGDDCTTISANIEILRNAETSLKSALDKIPKKQSFIKKWWENYSKSTSGVSETHLQNLTSEDKEDLENDGSVDETDPPKTELDRSELLQQIPEEKRESLELHIDQLRKLLPNDKKELRDKYKKEMSYLCRAIGHLHGIKGTYSPDGKETVLLDCNYGDLGDIIKYLNICNNSLIKCIQELRSMKPDNQQNDEKE